MTRGRAAVLAGMAASLVGIGLARFAYTPLIPVVIGAGWFGPGEAAYLGAANLVGYLAGALLAAPIVRRVVATDVVRAMMLAVALSFLACAWKLPFAWFFVWRFVAGFAGGAIMTLAAPIVLAHTPPAMRGRVGGIILTGVGLGVVAAGTLVPLLLGFGVTAAWLGIGAFSLVLTLLAWRAWPPSPLAQAAATGKPPATAWLLSLQYGFCAIGLVPHMVFLVDYVARGLGRGIAAGTVFFLLYGAGALVGPAIAGFVCDRIGVSRTLRYAIPVMAVVVGLPVLSSHDVVIGISSLLAGAYTPGIVSLVLARAQEIATGDPLRHRAIWGAATASYAAFQAVAAYIMAYLFARWPGAYDALFAAGFAALLIAAAIGWLPAMRRSVFSAEPGRSTR